jgi:hypothetical protein
MQVEHAMDAKTSRFISVQVPEGPAIADITDINNNVIWSEMVMTSPAVVNIIGTY